MTSNGHGAPGGPVGNTHRQIHGGYAGIKRLHDGGELKGVAADLRQAVHDDVEARGHVAVLREMAERHAAVAGLFYGLIVGASSPEKVEEFTRMFGWLSSGAFRMLAEVARLEKDKRGGMADYDELVKEVDK